MDLTDSTPCSASLDVVVDSNGQVTLTLVTDRRHEAHEFWLFDFQSHTNADFLVGRTLVANRTGNCSNLREGFPWGAVFNEADGTDEATNNDFNPLSSSGLLDTYEIGQWPNSPTPGVSIRKDTLSFTGPVDKLLNCRSSFEQQHVFSATAFGNQIELEGFAYATCVRPKNFSQSDLGVSTMEKKFPIKIRMSRKVTYVSVEAMTDDTGVLEARYNLAFLEPVTAPFSGGDLAGATFTTIKFDYFTVAKKKSESNLYNMLNVTSLMISYEGGEVMLVSDENLADSADGRCYLQEDGRCRQHFKFSVIVVTKTSLKKALNSIRETDKIVTGSFLVTSPVFECSSDVLSSTSCRSLGGMSKVEIEIRMSLDFSLITVNSKNPRMLMFGLRHVPGGRDATNEIVNLGDKLVLKSWIAPADISVNYNATLTKLTLCKKTDSDTCDDLSSINALVYYRNGSVVKGEVTTDYVDSELYRVYEVFFPIRRFSQDEENTLEATYNIKKLDGTGDSIESSFSLLVVQACPEYSTLQNEKCVCTSGFMWNGDENMCKRDTNVGSTDDPNVTDDPNATGKSRPTLKSPSKKPVKSRGVSPMVYVGVTLFMVIAAIYI